VLKFTELLSASLAADMGVLSLEGGGGYQVMMWKLVLVLNIAEILLVGR
jgi:hypothetical protein